MSDVVLSVEHLVRRLPGELPVTLIDDANLSLSKGEFVAITGPSGSGKSTLLGIIAGLDSPSSGQIVLDGIDITRMGESRLAQIRNQKIGMVFQAFNLIPTLTAQENVEVPLYVGKHRESPAKRAKALLEMVGLSHRLSHRPSQLSGGEQQRVAIARALATDPAVVMNVSGAGGVTRSG